MHVYQCGLQLFWRLQHCLTYYLELCVIHAINVHFNAKQYNAAVQTRLTQAISPQNVSWQCSNDLHQYSFCIGLNVWCFFFIGMTLMCSLMVTFLPACSTCCSKPVFKWPRPHIKFGRRKAVPPNHPSITNDLSTVGLCGVSACVNK